MPSPLTNLRGESKDVVPDVVELGSCKHPHVSEGAPTEAQALVAACQEKGQLAQRQKQPCPPPFILQGQLHLQLVKSLHPPGGKIEQEAVGARCQLVVNHGRP